MLENLIGRIQEKAPLALALPIPGFDLYYYRSRLKERLTDYPDFAAVEAEHRVASITFSYQELSELSGEEFLLLQQQLQTDISRCFAEKGETVPEQIASGIIPGSAQNVLIHEKEHLDVLPQELRKEASIDLVVTQGDGFYPSLPRGQMGLNGIALFDHARASDYDQARSAAAPQSRSQTDIEAALDYAQKTKDKDFIASIREKVGAVL